MTERKIVLFILFVIVYFLYSVNMWFTRTVKVEEKKIEDTQSEARIKLQLYTKNVTHESQHKWKPKVIPMNLISTCSILEIFTEKPTFKYKDNKDEEASDTETNPITVIGITIILIVLTLNALLDVLKVKEEEKTRRKLNPEGERRQSLAEFANKKPLRRECSKFGLQLFQIAESVVTPDEEKKTRRQSRPYTRGESINSYLSDRTSQKEGSASASVSETPTGEPRLVKRQSVAKLFGGPVPITRRSSFPALPLNPDVQALMLGHRQASVDSDDEGDGKGRRVRIIRRY